MNGLKHERLIRNYVEDARIVRGVTTWTAGIDVPVILTLWEAVP